MAESSYTAKVMDTGYTTKLYKDYNNSKSQVDKQQRKPLQTYRSTCTGTCNHKPTTNEQPLTLNNCFSVLGHLQDMDSHSGLNAYNGPSNAGVLTLMGNKNE